MLKVSKVIITSLISLWVLGFIVIFIYLITIEDSAADVIALVVMTLLCCRILYVVLYEYAFTKTEYMEVIKKIAVDEKSKNALINKRVFSAECTINGEKRVMYFKSKKDYYFISERKEYVVKRVGNRILEIK